MAGKCFMRGWRKRDEERVRVLDGLMCENEFHGVFIIVNASHMTLSLMDEEESHAFQSRFVSVQWMHSFWNAWSLLGTIQAIPLSECHYSARTQCLSEVFLPSHIDIELNIVDFRKRNDFGNGELILIQRFQLVLCLSSMHQQMLAWLFFRPWDLQIQFNS